MKAGRFSIPILVALTAATLISRRASALTSLTQVQASGNSQVDLLFDGKVGKPQVRTEFFNDVIQVSLTDVSVYPARIAAINGTLLTKIFAYQYAPKLVRCRLTVKGRAEDYKDRLEIVSSGRKLTLRLRDGSAPASGAGDGSLQAGAAAIAPGAPEAARGAGAAGTGKGTPGSAGASDQLALEAAHPEQADSGESALLDHVMNAVTEREEKPTRLGSPAASRRRKAGGARSERLGGTEGRSPGEGRSFGENRSFGSKSGGPGKAGDSGRLAGGVPLPSPLGVLGKLAAVLGLFGALALLLKRLGRGGAERDSASHQLSARLNARLSSGGENGLLGALGQLAQSASRGLGRREKMIEIVSNHYLGPKKSIAVVRIMGRVLVLGVSQDAINLITQIDDGAQAEELDLAELGLREGLLGAGPAPAPADRTFEPRPASPSPQAAARPASRRQDGGAMPAGPSIFAGVLREETLRPGSAPDVLPEGSVRSRIKSRLEGLKHL